MTDDPPVIVACTPVAVAPNLPAETPYSTYEQVPCPSCQTPMWLGTQGKHQVEHGASMLCMVCIIKLHVALGGDPDDLEIHPLIDPKGGKA